MKEHKREKKSLFVFTGGGTGGHVYPGLAVIERLREAWDGDLLWLGSRGGMEKGIVESWGLLFRGIPSGKLRRYFSFRNFSDVLRIAGGVLAALWIFIKRRPALVFSKGGYVSFPPVFAAWLLRIPALTHESDLDPGLATLLNAPFVKKIYVPYEESLRHFPKVFRKKLLVTGNPVRRAVSSGSAAEGLGLAGFSGTKPVVLVLGGSLGAQEINTLVHGSLEELLPRVDIIHQTGAGKFVDISRPGYFSAPYFNEEFPHILAAASVVVSRAGAGSLWEFRAAGKPALLIPLRESSRGDQVRNAELFQKRGAAHVLDGPSITTEDFVRALWAVLEPAEQQRMRQAAAADEEGRDAARIIAGLLLDYLPGST